MILEDQIKAKMVYTDISDYLYDTEMDLYKCIWEKEKLCELDHLWSQIQPDYSNYTLQHFYSLRYTYAYAFENKEMYRRILEDYFRSNYGASLKIESIGCGNMVDGWSLFSILMEKGREYCHAVDQIDYKGIDRIEWRNPLITREHFINIDAAKWFEKKNYLDANAYIFPRSIGDFSEEEFGCVLQAFSKKELLSKTLYLMVSIRKGSSISSTDTTRAIELSRRIINQGYKSKCLELLKEYDNTGIHQLDETLSYPKEIIRFLRSMRQRPVCNGFSEHDDKCVHQCDIDNFPMLNANNLCFLIMKYERE